MFNSCSAHGAKDWRAKNTSHQISSEHEQRTSTGGSKSKNFGIYPMHCWCISKWEEKKAWRCCERCKLWYWREIRDWKKDFRRAMEMMRVPLVMILVRDMRLKVFDQAVEMLWMPGAATLEMFRALQITDTVTYWLSGKNSRILRVPQGLIFQIMVRVTYGTFFGSHKHAAAQSVFWSGQLRINRPQ